MEILKITEVGVAVKDIDKASRLFVDFLGAKAGKIKTVERYQMRYRMCKLGDVDFELMDPIGDGGTIANFLKVRPEGLHHVAFAVDNLEEWLSFLKEKGVRLIDEEPQDLLGAKVAFVHPSSFNGVMFELIEYPDDGILNYLRSGQ